MEKTIELCVNLDTDTIMAGFFLDGQPEPEIVAVMGTHLIPTPYRTRCRETADQAAREIARRNPGYRVIRINL